MFGCYTVVLLAVNLDDCKGRRDSVGVVVAGDLRR